MVEYHCVLCSYTTNLKPHYERHCKTKKHIANEKEQIKQKKDDVPKNAPKVHPDAPKMHPDAPKKIDNKTCQFCEKRFTRTTGLKKHLKVCSLNKNIKNAPKCTQNTTKIPQNTTILPQNTTILPQNTTKIFECKFCNKILSRYDSLSRHLKTCKVKKEEEGNNNMQIEILKKEVKELKESNKGTTINNTQNNNYITTNYLNLNFQNMQTIEDFLENLKNKYQLSITDRKCLLNTFNECGIDAFAETFSIIMKKYQSEQVEKGLLPTMPLVCTDGNLRSMKEYHENGWKTTQSNSSIDKMINISNDQIYESEKTMVYLSAKDRKKIHNRIKQDNTLLNLEEIKKNYQLKTKILPNIDLNNDFEDKDKEIQELLQDNPDFSIINDDYIEKYSKL